MNNELNEKYISITHLIQNEFDRNIEKYGDKINCRKGCSQCCSQIFRITQLDANIIKNHLNEMPAEEKFILKEKAVSYLDKITKANFIKEENYINAKIPCPALDEIGSCIIYSARPVVCRRFGPPVFDYKNPDKLHACELNFADGEEINDIELIPAQTLIGKEWDQLKLIFNTENDFKENASTTIAEAILNS